MSGAALLQSQSTNSNDTIVALATPPGRGGIAILRISGPQARPLAEQICQQQLRARYALLTQFHQLDNNKSSAITNGSSLIDEGIALFFPAPNSYTGEDVVELHCHGSPLVVDLLQQSLIRVGTRQARPGEFSERAYLNDKIDLAQAEAVADLISSGSEQAARAAMRSLQGEFSLTINAFVERLVKLRVFVEAALDFPDEDVDFIQNADIHGQLAQCRQQLHAVFEQARQGAVLQEGLHIAIAGRPNAGKSSLLNLLAGYDSAIVTAIAGTTRDVLREYVSIDGLPLHLMDTAGLRDSPDEVEREGIRRAHSVFEQADHILLIVDSKLEASLELSSLWPDDKLPQEFAGKVTIVRNKIDLVGDAPGLLEQCAIPTINISATQKSGLTELKTHLHRLAGFEPAAQSIFSARRRHLSALQAALEFIDEAIVQTKSQSAPELLAEDLRAAHDQLSTITGSNHPDELLGEIFAGFCIGK